MKILYVSKVAPHLGISHVHEVARRLAARGHEVHVLAAATRPHQARQEIVDGVVVTTLATMPSAVRSQRRLGFFATRVPFYAAAAAVVNRRYRDVDVIIEDVAPLRSPMLPAVARRLGIPLVYQTHNAYPDRHAWTSTYGRKGNLGWVWDRMFRSHPKCDALFADAQYTAASYDGLPCPVLWIPNGIDATQFSPAAETRCEPPMRLLSVGRVIALKNHRVLIEAMASAPDVTLRIVGDGPERPALEQLAARLGVADRVTFTGFIDKAKLAPEYQAADLFVLPSFWEGLPHVVLEAMASGLPVAMSDIYAADGLIDPAFGWRLPPRESAAWATLFNDLARDAATRREMGRIARKTALGWADWDQITTDVLTLLGRVGAGRR